MSRQPRPLHAAIAGAVAGVALCVAVAPPQARETEPARRARHDAAAADGFVAAWRRSRTGAWAADVSIVRELAHRPPFALEVTRAQRPPDRASYGGGSYDALIGGERVACITSPEGTPECRRAPAERDYYAEVAADAALLRDLVTGAGRTYDVRPARGGCFDLLLARAVVSAPYGRRATWCFDGATGAPRLVSILRPEGSERAESRNFRAPTDADFTPPAP